MKKLSILELQQEENNKPLKDSLLFSLSESIITLDNSKLKSKSKMYYHLKRVRLIESYLVQVLKMTNNYDRFVKQSLYSELEAYLNTLDIESKTVNIDNLKKVLGSLSTIQYKEFLKTNISGVKNPKDKIAIYLQFHTNNINLLNS